MAISRLTVIDIHCGASAGPGTHVANLISGGAFDIADLIPTSSLLSAFPRGVLPPENDADRSEVLCLKNH